MMPSIWALVLMGSTLFFPQALDDPPKPAPAQIEEFDLQELERVREQQRQLALVEQYLLGFIQRKYKIQRGDRINWDTGSIDRGAPPQPQ